MLDKITHTLTTRLTKNFFIMMLIPILLVSFMYYQITYKEYKEMLQNELVHLAKGAAISINPAQIKELEIAKSTESSAYKAVNQFLIDYKNQVNANYVYILKKDKTITRFLAHGGQIGNSVSVDINEPYRLNQYMESAFRGKASVTDKTYTDRWGTFLTGYAPVFDADGDVYYIVGIDIDASKLTAIKKVILIHIFAAVILSMLLSFVLAYYYAKQRINQDNKIYNAILQAGAGNFSTFCKVDAKDYIETRILADSFNRMIRQIKAFIDKSQEASRLKSEFIANMSHELRTPLNSIIGYTNLVLKQAKDTLSPKLVKHLQTVERNGQHLLELINQILDLSAIEAGKKHLVLEEFNCINLIDDVIELALPLARKKNLKLKNVSSEKEIVIYSDRQKLLQILINLTGNAIKFTEKGEIKLKAESVLLEGDIHGINIYVSDTGVGIHQDDIETIFEPFRQLDGSVSRQQGGAGLGLHLTQKLCHLLNGAITVKSKVNNGSTFTCCFPKETVLKQ